MQDQTVGSNTCEGGRAPGKRVNPGKLWDRYRLGLQPVLSSNIREGSMYSQAHISHKLGKKLPTTGIASGTPVTILQAQYPTWSQGNE